MKGRLECWKRRCDDQTKDRVAAINSTFYTPTLNFDDSPMTQKAMVLFGPCELEDQKKIEPSLKIVVFRCH